MSTRSALGTTALVLAMAVGGVALLVAVAIGVAQYTEDLCFDDLETLPGYGAYRSEWTPWPPSFDCELSGNEVDPVVVRHRGVAVAGLTAVAAVTIFCAAAVTAGVNLGIRRRRGDQDGLP